MDNPQLGAKVREYRTRKGMSQELLADESGLSHRTIQRIENSESNPTGDTLQRLSTALGVSPDDLIDWQINEDRGYLANMNLSALAFIPFPLLGILVPFIMWTVKKGQLKGLDEVGRDLINFQINWVLLLTLIPFIFFLVGESGLSLRLTFFSLVLFLSSMYLINIVIVITNSLRIHNGKEVLYYSLIKFVR